MKLYLLQLGLLQPLRVPVPGYLIQSDDGTNILVDTGYPYSFIDDPPGPQGPLNLPLDCGPTTSTISFARTSTLTMQETTNSFPTPNWWSSAGITRLRVRDTPV